MKTAALILGIIGGIAGIIGSFIYLLFFLIGGKIIEDKIIYNKIK